MGRLSQWLVALALVAASAPSAAQQAGELVEPDVLLVIDSSASMDWHGDAPVGKGNVQWSTERCELDDPTSLTSWQKVLNAFLGGIPGASYHCSVENAPARPALDALEITNLADPTYLPDYVSEFKKGQPHFRAVNCPPKGGVSMWNSGQCIDVRGSSNGADYNTTMVAGGYLCPDDRVSTQLGPGGAEYCLELHPEAQPRQSNGIMDRYETMVRFGVATYDNTPVVLGNACAPGDNACIEHANMWNYGTSRDWTCGAFSDGVAAGQGMGASGGDLCNGWNAGIRAPFRSPANNPILGGLVSIDDNLVQSNDRVRRVLSTAEPLNCSPIGAMLDDVGYYFSHAQAVLPASGTGQFAGADRFYRCRPKVAIFISDGQPTRAFEFPAGYCSGAEATWKPTNPNPSGTMFDCPWRSSAEEAAELFDVSMDALASTGNVQPDDQPVFLVTIGFNVPDVDCTDPAQQASCIPYTASYYRDRHCWRGLPQCGAAPDAGAADAAAPDAGVPDEICLMSPRQYLNEVACQGWPYDPAVVFQSHETAIMPPWIDPAAGICGDDPAADYCLADDDERALFVTSESDLSKVLDLVLANLSSTLASRTDLVVANVPVSVSSLDAVGQWEIRSGYVSRPGRPWMGALVRHDWRCPGNEQMTDTKNIAEAVDEQGASTRTLYSFSPPGTMTYPDPSQPSQVQSWVNTTFDLAELDSATAFDDCDFGMQSVVGGLCAGNHLVQNEVSDRLKARGLADIYNATPALLAPPSARISVPSYTEFSNNNGAADGRKNFLYTATNDGVLHALDVDEMDASPPTNVDKWGYVPTPVVGLLKDQFPLPPIVVQGPGYSFGPVSDVGLQQHLFLMDGSPVARDVLLWRDLTTPAAISDEALYWRSIVFGGLGKGGRGYYALDVTTNAMNAAQPPKLRWEIAPEQGLFGNNSDAEATGAFGAMGYPLSKPAVAYVRYSYTKTNATADGGTEDVGQLAQTAAAILPGGWKVNATDSTGVYIVRLGDGKLLRYLKPGRNKNDDPNSDMCSGSPGLLWDSGNSKFLESAQLVGEPATTYGTSTLKTTTEAWIGDDRGRLWLIDMMDPNPDNWCLRLYFDTLLAWHYPYENCIDPSCSPDPTDCVHQDCCVPSAGFDPGVCAQGAVSRNMHSPRAMILGAPTIATNDRDEFVIVFGTGGYDTLSAWNRNRVFSLRASRSGAHTPSINWWIGDPIHAASPYNVFNDAEAAWKNGIQVNMLATYVHADWVGDAVGGIGSPTPPQYVWNVGEKLVGKPVIFDEVAYFTTYVPIEDGYSPSVDACEAGSSRIWALDYDYRMGVDTGVSFADPLNCGLGKFDGPSDAKRLWIDAVGDLLSGVQVVRRPRCDNIGDAVFELVVQKANPAVTPTGEGAPPTNAIVSQAFAINKSAGIGLTQVRFDSWSIVFE